LNAAFAIKNLDIISQALLVSFVTKLPKYLKHSRFSSYF
jgi:hypothetical protein